VSNRGRLITFEGGEGAGKSTQIRRLAARLEKAGRDVVLTREPGGETGAEDIRKLLVTGEPGRWEPLTEVLLFFAARHNHVMRTIRPALARGAWVLSDRFYDSTLAYQAGAHGVPETVVRQLVDVACGPTRPDLTLILDLPVTEGLARAGARAGDETRFERMGTAFHERLRQAFLAIAAAEPGRCRVVNGLGSADDVAARIDQALAPLEA